MLRSFCSYLQHLCLNVSETKTHRCTSKSIASFPLEARVSPRIKGQQPDRCDKTYKLVSSLRALVRKCNCHAFQRFAICYTVYQLLPIRSATHSTPATRDLGAFQTSANTMALIEALSTARVVYSDGFSERSSYVDYCSSVESSLQYNPDHTSRDSHLVMNDRDKGIYNSLGSSSSPAGKVRVHTKHRISYLHSATLTYMYVSL